MDYFGSAVQSAVGNGEVRDAVRVAVADALKRIDDDFTRLNTAQRNATEFGRRVTVSLAYLERQLECTCFPDLDRESGDCTRCDLEDILHGDVA